MRKDTLVGSLAVLLLLLLLGTVAHQSISRRPAVILFEPPRLPGAHIETEVEGGQNSPLPAPRGRATKPVKRRLSLPPMVA
jgi:hypothetical protein